MPIRKQLTITTGMVGALAYGHPYGASGGIITIHACRALQETPGYAVCSIAAAGGIGHALLLRTGGM